MSRQQDVHGLTIDDFDERYQEYFDPRRNLTRIRCLSGAPAASVEDAIDMIELLLDKYQNHFIIHATNKWVVQFPYLLKEPSVGSELYNLTKDTIYTVENVLVEGDNRVWNHWVKLSGPTGVEPSDQDNLVWTDKKHLFVRFVLAYPVSDAKPSEATGGVLGDRKYGPWSPTITANITRREPWGLDGPFSKRKQLKPKLFEVFRDPTDRARYSIEIYRQAYDNLVNFDCWAQDPYEGMRLANWFEDFMQMYVGVLKNNGVHEILEWSHSDIPPDERWRDDLIGQRMTYFMRTEKLRIARTRNLTNLVFRMRVARHPVGYVPGGNPTTGDHELWYWRVHNDTGGYLYGSFDVEDHGWAIPSHLPADGSYSRPDLYQYNPGIEEYKT